MIVALEDPRDLDRHHTATSHRPDLPSAYQIDTLWSYAEAPGGWYANPPSQSLAAPELSTWVMLSLGLACLFLVRKRKAPRSRIGD